MDMGEVQVRPVKATFGVWLFLAPCLVAFLAVPVAAAPASEACGSDLQEADWNKTVDRAALVPWNVFMPYDDVYYEEPYYEDEPYRSSEDTQRNSTLHPEEDWMVSWR